MQKCIYTSISSNLSLYEYSINTVAGEIIINQNKLAKNQDQSFRNFPSYTRVVRQNYVINESDFFYAFVSFCDKTSEKLTVEYNVINPGNEHLSTDTIPNKVTYFI